MIEICKKLCLKSNERQVPSNFGHFMIFLSVTWNEINFNSAFYLYLPITPAVMGLEINYEFIKCLFLQQFFTYPWFTPILSTKWLNDCSLMLCNAFFSSSANSIKSERCAHRANLVSSGLHTCDGFKPLAAMYVEPIVLIFIPRT